jgi:diadenosine tetraphosphatase ApaH/serine/threonine PP2A family protein phosphatase
LFYGSAQHPAKPATVTPQPKPPHDPTRDVGRKPGNLQAPQQNGEVLFVNCGSVGKPKDGDPRGAFAVLTPNAGSVAVSIERIEYDADAVAAEVR